MRLLAVSVLILAIGCAGGAGRRGGGEEEGVEEMDLGGLPERAAFDLGCHGSKLRFRKFDNLTVGVKGCGKRGTYVETCRNGNWDPECTWLLNGAIESTKPEPKPEPEQKPEPKPEPESEPSSPDEP